MLLHSRSPGDVVVLTGFVRDLAAARGPELKLFVTTSAADLWRHNPYVSPKVANREDIRNFNLQFLKMDYGLGIREQVHWAVHFMPYFHEFFRRTTGQTIPLTQPFPDLHFGPDEAEPVVSGDYWVVVGGGKSDYPIKVWHKHGFQKVVDGLGRRGFGVVQVGSLDKDHWHYQLQGPHVLDLVGKTNLRDLMRVIRDSKGVICGITCAMHMAAALQKPCVVIGGGREAWWWEAYVKENPSLAPVVDKLIVPHRYLHTIGQLSCCQSAGCWKDHLPGNGKKNVCLLPTVVDDQVVGTCMRMITAEHVLAAVDSYGLAGSDRPPKLSIPTELWSF